MSRKKAPATRLPRTAPKPWIDARVLLVAALIASPAAYRSEQGLLPTTTALDRFLAVAVGCVVLSSLVRLVWPMVIGEQPAETRTVAGVPMPAEAADALDPTLVDDVYAELTVDGSRDSASSAGTSSPGGIASLDDPMMTDPAAPAALPATTTAMPSTQPATTDA